GQLGDRVAFGQRLLGKHVQSGAGDRLALQRLDQRRLVHDSAARGVDQNGGALHHVELALTHDVDGLLRLADVQADHVGAAVEVVKLHELNVELLSQQNVRVARPGDHLHADAASNAGDLLADGAEAD